MTKPGNTTHVTATQLGGRGKKRRAARVHRLFDDLIARDPRVAEAVLVIQERATAPRGAKLLDAVGVIVHFAVTHASVSTEHSRRAL